MQLSKYILGDICFGNIFGTINNIYMTDSANITMTFTDRAPCILANPHSTHVLREIGCFKETVYTFLSVDIIQQHSEMSCAIFFELEICVYSNLIESLILLRSLPRHD